MSPPIVFLSRNKIKAGKGEKFRNHYQAGASAIFAGKAGILVHLAPGFTITVLTIWLLPILQGIFSWRWAFSQLAIHPVSGIWAMLRLKLSPKFAKIGGGKG